MADVDFSDLIPAKPAASGNSCADLIPPAEAPWRNTARNVAAGAAGGATSLIDAVMDPFGNVIGPTIARVGGTLYDAGAHLTGLYPPMSPEQRADLYGQPPPNPEERRFYADPAQQPPASRLIFNLADQSIPGPKMVDIQANTPTEQITRKLAGAATGGGVTAGIPGALVAAGGALVGDVAGRVATESGMDWLAPGAELAGNYTGGKVAQKVISPINTVTSPERKRLVEVLDAEGVPLTAGERTGSKPLLKTEQVLGQTPGSAGGISSDVAEQQAAINRAVARKAGLDTDTLTTEVVNNHMYKVLGPEIDRLATNNTMQITPAFQQTVRDVRTNLVGMKSNAAVEIKDLLNGFDNKIQTDPATGAKTMPGKFYQSLMSDFGDAIKSAQGSTRGELIKVRDGIRTQMESSMLPQDAALWRELNRKYANAALIQDAINAAGAGTAEGNISPLQLRQGINQSLGSGAYGEGRGDLNDMAHAGQSVLRKPPDSGSPAGIAINALMKGIPLATGAAGGYLQGLEGFAAGLAVPAAIGTVMRGRIPGTDYSPGQHYLSNRVASDLSPAALTAAIQAAEAERRRHPLMLRYRD
jgi:hypothetical protein